MGLFDKLKGALQGPDLALVLREVVGDDGFLAHAAVMPSSTEAVGREKRVRDVTDLAQRAARNMMDDADQKRHIGGPEGSIGRSLSRRPEGLALALAERSVTLWRFGLGAKRTNPDLVVRLPRDQVTSIADTGKRGARGHVRLTFADGSFFDYQAVTAPGDEFWHVIDTWS